MPSPKAMTGVVARLAPFLKADGFRRLGTSFNRVTEPGLIHVVGFQASNWSDQLTVNLGVYVREIDDLFDSVWGGSKAGVPGVDGAVREYECWLRARLGEIRRGGRDVWWSYANLDAAVSDIAARLQADASPAFAAARSRDALMGWWRDREQHPFLWRVEPRTPLGFALLMKQSGAVDEAQSVFEAVWAATQGKPFQFMVSVLAEEIGLKPAG